MDELPAPDAKALSHSRRLGDLIRTEIQEQGGSINFARFMELALYEPGLGYYSAGSQKIGEDGDFVTAPEISRLFSICLARQCSEILSDMDKPAVLELGAGRGTMACDLLIELERLDCLPGRYLILETSADLRQRQKALLLERVPGLVPRVEWLDTLPGEFEGVILANEVLDALPVRRFSAGEKVIHELCVVCDEENFFWDEQAADEELKNRITKIGRTLVSEFAPGYRSEINDRLPSWMAAIAESLKRGIILFVDYGYSRHEYYHEQRQDGTLVCHYRHRVHSDPFFYPGLQDISASVDFTALAEAAVESGLDVKGFTTQAFFLFGCGLEQVMQDRPVESEIERLDLARQVKLLTLPAEMGERFKVMALGRGVQRELSGFSVVDHRHRL